MSRNNIKIDNDEKCIKNNTQTQIYTIVKQLNTTLINLKKKILKTIKNKSSVCQKQCKFLRNEIISSQLKPRIPYLANILPQSKK